MTILVKCPGCESTRKLKDDSEGKVIACKSCGETFRVQRAGKAIKKLKVKKRSSKSSSNTVSEKKRTKKRNPEKTEARRSKTKKTHSEKVEINSQKTKMPWLTILASAISICVIAGIYFVGFSASASNDPASDDATKNEVAKKEDPAEKPEPFKDDKDRIAEISLGMMNYVDSFNYFPATDGQGFNRSKYKHGNLS